MKKGLIVLLIFILVVCAFFVGTNINTNYEFTTNVQESCTDSDTTVVFQTTDTITTNIEQESTFVNIENRFDDVYSSYDEYYNNLLNFVGIWENYYDGNLVSIISINDVGEFYEIEVEFNEYGWFYVTNYTEYSISNITKDRFGTESYGYRLENKDTLIKEAPSGDFVYERKTTDYVGSFNSVTGSWAPYNYLKTSFKLIYLSYGSLSEISIYSDRTFKVISEYGNEYYGKYGLINDGDALQIEYGGNVDVYTYELLENGLMILSCTGNDSGKGSTLKYYYCLLELT